MADLVVEPAAGLAGEVPPPADKSIVHRALILGSIAGGPSLISYAHSGEDCEFAGLGDDNRAEADCEDDDDGCCRIGQDVVDHGAQVRRPQDARRLHVGHLAQAQDGPTHDATPG